MKRHVQAEHAAQVAGACGFVMLGLDPFELGQLGGVDGKDDPARRIGLQQFPQRVQLGDFAQGERLHQRANMPAPFHQTATFELGQHLARNVPLQVEALAQIVFDEPFPRMQQAEHDLLFELIRDTPHRFIGVAVAQHRAARVRRAFRHDSVAHTGRLHKSAETAERSAKRASRTGLLRIRACSRAR